MSGVSRSSSGLDCNRQLSAHGRIEIFRAGNGPGHPVSLQDDGNL